MHSKISYIFRRFGNVASIVFLTILLAGAAHAQQFVDGKDYETLPGEPRVLKDGTVEMIEFLWFGCPACYRFEPAKLSWLEHGKPDSITFVAVPAVLRDSWEFHARVHFAFELLGMLDELSVKFFDEIHREGNRIRTVDELREWAERQDGVDVEKLVQTLSSFATNTKLNQSRLQAKKFGVGGVPTLIVGSKYRTSPHMAGSSERALEIVEYLASKILSENSGSN